MDLASLIKKLIDDREFQNVATNPMAQFGPGNAPLLGATLLPERIVQENAFEEEEIRYRTVIATDGTRYSPAQLRDTGEMYGTMKVFLGNSDIAREFTSKDYDAVLDYLLRNMDINAAAAIMGWSETTLNQALVQFNEKQRWQAIVDCKVTRKGDNGYLEEVAYPNPTNHRVAVSSDWSDSNTDPYEDVVERVNLLSDKGYEVNRIICGRKVLNLMLRNPNIAKRSGRIVVLGGTASETMTGRVTKADLDSIFASDGLPAIETYNARYMDETAGWNRYLRDDVMVFAATTGQNEEVRFDKDNITEIAVTVENTLGYSAIGRAAGQSTSGRVVRVEQFNNKPPRLEGEGWQTSLPVITQPEAIAVLYGIS